jgi:hypothetical protein
MVEYERPFVGSEALSRGVLKRHQLRAGFRAVFPDVYIRKDDPLALRQRAAAAWLWSHRQGVVAGLTAAALHGSKWVPDDAPIELIWPNARPPRGVQTYDMRLCAQEYRLLAGLPVTTPERTAFDLGRQPPIGAAVARLDALARATGIASAAVADIAGRNRGARGLRQLERVLGLVDPGAQSPKETWLRLLLIRVGLPRPRTQIRCSAMTAARPITSTWAGRTSWWPSNTTASSIASTDGSTPGTSVDWKS